MCCRAQLGDSILRTLGALEIYLQANELPVQAAGRFPEQTRLSNSPLAGQQQVGPIPQVVEEQFHFVSPVPEPIAGDPPTGCPLHRDLQGHIITTHTLPSLLLATKLMEFLDGLWNGPFKYA
jgi:hypothetical protein